MNIPAIDGLSVIPTNHTAAEVLARIVSIAKSSGVTIFAQIDFSGDAARSNFTLRPTGLVILGNPTAGSPLMMATPTVAIDLPLKLLAFEDAHGRTWVAYNEPEYLQSRHGFPEALITNLSSIRGLAHAAAATD